MFRSLSVSISNLQEFTLLLRAPHRDLARHDPTGSTIDEACGGRMINASKTRLLTVLKLLLGSTVVAS